MIEVMPPHGPLHLLPCDRRRTRRYVALAGGSGITPMLSILKTALRDEPRQPRSRCSTATATAATIMFLEELAGLKNRYLDRLEVYHFLEDEAEEIELFNGRLDARRCDEVFASLVDAAAADAVLHLRPRPDDGRRRAGAGSRAASQPRTILIERFTTGIALRRAARARRGAAAEGGRARRSPSTLDGRALEVAVRRRRRAISSKACRPPACPRPTPARAASAPPAAPRSSRVR